MHMHQQNHWNRVLFYWYESYHWYQWTISLTNRIRLCILDMCGITATTAKGWVQEEGMDEDTAMVKEGVRAIIYGSPERQKNLI